MKTSRILFALAGFAVLIPAAWAAVRDVNINPDLFDLMNKTRYDTLRGLPGVFAFVSIDPTTTSFGLTQEDLRTDLELQLHQYGIKVLSAGEVGAMRGLPILNIQVASAHAATDPFVTTLARVEFRQRVLLERDPNISTYLATWAKERQPTVRSSEIRKVREDVKDMVAAFINDYLAANPKESKSKEPAAQSKP